MEGVEPGEVKWLRINEALPRYWSTGRRWDPSLSSSSWKAALWPRVQWGVVPVEEDGSAYFVVPAQRSIFYQALDKDFREIQRERTYVNYASGEVRSCNGCHGQASHAVPPVGSATPLALMRAPSIPQPQPCDLVENGGDGQAGQVIHYPTDIQPILDAKCISCHGQTDPAGGLILTGEVTTYYNTSYEQLASKELAGPIIPEFTSFLSGDRGNYNGAYLPPRSLGCCHEHHDGHLDQLRSSEERQGRPLPDAHRTRIDDCESLGGFQLSVLRFLFRSAASAMGQSGSQRSRLQSGRLPPQADVRRSHQFPGAGLAPVDPQNLECTFAIAATQDCVGGDPDAFPSGAGRGAGDVRVIER